jgi:hypothetical protein
MIGPKRFVASKGLKADLLASARGDRPSQASRRRALVAAGAAGAAAAASSSTSLAMGSSVVRWAVWKWVAAGLAGTVAVVTARSVLVPIPPPSVATATTAVAAPTGPLVSRADMSHAPDAVPEQVQEAAKPSVADLEKEGARAAKAAPRPLVRTFTASTLTNNMVEPARAPVPVPSSSQLAGEIATLDQAKHAVKAGDAQRALKILDSYDTTFATGALAPEAAALRIEALARAGRRAEAQAALGSFRSSHPESPLIGVLSGIVDGS